MRGAGPDGSRPMKPGNPVERRDPTLRQRQAGQPVMGGAAVLRQRPFRDSKATHLDADQRRKANRGAAGVDGVSFAVSETDLREKSHKGLELDGVGILPISCPCGSSRSRRNSVRHAAPGIPTVSDRVAQTVVTMVLTRIVYCKDDDRPGQHEHIAFDLHDFLPHELTCSCSCRVNSLYDIAQIPPVFDYFMAAGGCPACAAWPQIGRRCPARIS